MSAVSRPVRRRARSKGDRREQAILDTAASLLETVPLPQLTIDALAAGAGISRSSFYFYFDSKSAVVAALLEGLSDEWAEESGPWLDGSGRDEPALRQATAHSVRLWRTHGGLLRQAYRAGPDDPQLQAWRDAVVGRHTRRLAARIERDRAAGVAPPGPPTPEALAALVLGMRNAAFAAYGPGGSDGSGESGEGSDERLVDDLVTATTRLLYGRV